ncbi:MAG: hypothetical protein ACFFCE_02935 [Promethearchaeota archaeon]
MAWIIKMISFIIGGILLVWCIVNRYSKNGKVIGEPLGMPKGTVRALITIMLVSFPLGYILEEDQEIPGLIINSIFVAVAFYFEARKSEREKLQQIVNEIKDPEMVTIDLRKEKFPLYLPKYTVRFFLIIILVAILIVNYYLYQTPFEITNTLIDLLIIISLFIFGGIFRSISKSRERKRIGEEVKNMDASLTDIQVVEKLMLEPSWWKSTGRSILSIIMLITIITALTFYIFEWNYEIYTIEFTATDTYVFSVRAILLLLINAYYGFRA